MTLIGDFGGRSKRESPINVTINGDLLLLDHYNGDLVNAHGIYLRRKEGKRPYGKKN